MYCLFVRRCYLPFLYLYLGFLIYSCLFTLCFSSLWFVNSSAAFRNASRRLSHFVFLISFVFAITSYMCVHLCSVFVRRSQLWLIVSSFFFSMYSVIVRRSSFLDLIYLVVGIRSSFLVCSSNVSARLSSLSCVSHALLFLLTSLLCMLPSLLARIVYRFVIACSVFVIVSPLYVLMYFWILAYVLCLMCPLLFIIVSFFFLLC